MSEFVLHIDLTTEKCRKEPYEFKKGVPYGRGLAAKLIEDHTGLETDRYDRKRNRTDTGIAGRLQDPQRRPDVYRHGGRQRKGIADVQYYRKYASETGQPGTCRKS